MTLTITIPVASTCAPLVAPLALDTLAALQLPGATALPAAFDSRNTHPFVNPRVLQHVATARGVVVENSKFTCESAQECLPALAARTAPLAYVVAGRNEVKQELFCRGPLLTTMQVTQHFCDYWSHLLRRARAGEKHKAYHTKDKTPHQYATILVALLGWTQDDEWVVALGWGGWGAACTDVLHDYGHNGCCIVQMGCLGLESTCVGILPAVPPVDGVNMQVYRCVHPFVPPALPRGKPKVQVKAKVVLAHGENKSQHPKSMMQKVSAGDIASITFMALTIAIVAIFLCFSLTRKRTRVKK